MGPLTGLSPSPIVPQMLTEHMDVSLGDGVEAAAGQQDDVRLTGFRHSDSVRSRFSRVLFDR